MYEQIENYLANTAKIEEKAQRIVNELTKQKVEDHHMRKIEETYYDPEPTITISSIERQGCLVTYQIMLGAFALDLKVLHILHNRPLTSNEVLGRGSFGLVQLMSVKGKRFVSKRFNIGSNKPEVGSEQN